MVYTVATPCAVGLEERILQKNMWFSVFLFVWIIFLLLFRFPFFCNFQIFVALQLFFLLRSCHIFCILLGQQQMHKIICISVFLGCSVLFFLKVCIHVHNAGWGESSSSGFGPSRVQANLSSWEVVKVLAD